MRLKRAKRIVDRIYPFIEKDYGWSKYQKKFPYIDFEKSMFDSPSQEDDAHGDYDSEENIITLYYPKLRTKKQLIQTLLHEYKHYLQSPRWRSRYFSMGYHYGNHPYEIEAKEEEKNWKKYAKVK